jgi:transcription elongation factor Elf1
MKNSNVAKFWLTCTCNGKVKLAKVTKDAGGGAFIDCKRCKREVEIIYREGLKPVESASAIASA